MRTKPNTTILLSSLLMLCCIFPAKAQLVLRENPQPVSPQSSEMTRYGKHNVNMYTGRISINIPIYTYKDADFELPVSLSYNFNGFRPNEQPSEVGVGWSLSCGGVITREVRGLPDEENGHMKVFANDTDWETTVYAYDKISTVSYSGHLSNVYPEVLTGDISKDRAINMCYNILSYYYDAQPDVYHFSFPGHSGSFVRRPDGTFAVFDTGGDMVYKIEKVNADDGSGTDSILSEITITTGDGYKYMFGGGIYSGDQKDGERYCERVARGKEDTSLGRITAWKLNRIIAPGGRCLFFGYSDPCEVMSFGQPLWFPSNASPQSGSIYDEGAIIKTLPLSEVYNDDRTVIDIEYATKDENHSGLFINGDTPYNVLNPAHATLLLTNIYCDGDTTSLTHKWNPNGNPYPFLESVTTNTTGTYRMEYCDLDTRYFPHYGTQAHDHWGYLNSSLQGAMISDYVNWNNVSTLYSNYEEILGTFFNPNTIASSLGLITKITYPTGGYSEFTYEGNSYTRAIQKILAYNFDLSDETCSGTGPGSRIRTIVTRDCDGTVKDSLSYSYSGYNDLPSGRLLAYPRHQIAYGGTFGYSQLFAHFYTTGNIFRSGDVVVEYPCVTEYRRDGSRTKYEFVDWTLCQDAIASSYVFGLYRNNGYILSHMTNVPNRAGLQYLLSPPSKKDALRGKPFRQTTYAAGSNTPIKSTEFAYSYLDESYYEYLNVGDDCSRITHFAYNPRVMSSSDTLRYSTGKVIATTNRTYNNLNQVTSETTQRADGIWLQTSYTYPSDYPDSTVLAAMAAAGVNGYPVTITTEKKAAGENTWTALSAVRYTFAELTNMDNEKMYLPVIIEQQDVETGIWKTKETRAYNTYGDLIQSVDATGTSSVYLWHEYGLGPGLIIQNASFAQISAIPSLSGYTGEPLSDSNITSAASAIRSALPNARLWEIHYHKAGKPSTIIGPDGIEKDWSYDEAGRLVSESESGIGRIFNIVYSTKTRLK